MKIAFGETLRYGHRSWRANFMMEKSYSPAQERQEKLARMDATLPPFESGQVRSNDVWWRSQESLRHHLKVLGICVLLPHGNISPRWLDQDNHRELESLVHKDSNGKRRSRYQPLVIPWPTRKPAMLW